MGRITRTLLTVTFVAAATGWFLLSTVLIDELPKPWIVAVAAAFALVAAIVFTSREPHTPSVSGPQGLLVPAAVGVLMLFAAPTLVMVNRLTDAPPGSEVLFFTTATWGVLGVLGAALVPSSQPSLRRVAFAFVGLLGAAAVLANWERPSSFSPMIRYAEQDTGLILAGVAWVAGTLLMSYWYRGRSDRRSVIVAASSGAIVAVVYALIVSGAEAVNALPQYTTPLLVLGVSFAAMMSSWVALALAVGPVRVNGVWLLPPLAVTAIAVFEQAFSPRGPDPVVWAGVGAGAVLIVLGFLGLSSDDEAVHASALGGDESDSLSRVLLGMSATALVGGVVALGLPAFRASVTGTLASGKAYSADWVMLGYESAGGWIPVVAGALLLTAVLGLSRRGTWTAKLLSAVASLLAVAVYPLLASTPLHTWNRWVPSEIQSEYGTEYALLEMTAVHDPVRLAALAVAGVGSVLLLVLAARDMRRSRSSAEVTSEVVQ